MTNKLKICQLSVFSSWFVIGVLDGLLLVSSMDSRGEMKVFHNDKGLFCLFWLIVVVLFQESCPMGKRERGAERVAEKGSDNNR